MTVVRRHIPWHPSEHGGPLGRNVEHDPMSRQFTVTRAVGTRDRVLHKRHGKILDQGNLGSCTGNALVGALECDPVHHRFERWNEKKAIKVYSHATAIDEFPGSYPPDDTGSSGLSVCKAGVELGWLRAYQHAFGIDQALDALQVGPVITGVDWYEGFDRPDASGLVSIAGEVRGGHEFVVRGFIPYADTLQSRVLADNSWSSRWGREGHFAMTVRTWATLLEAQGDVTVPLR
jgi:hypothetical protein